MSELHVKFRKDRPILCGGCGTRFVPDDGPVLGVDDILEDWPIVICPGCQHTVACGPAHVISMEVVL